MSELGKYQLPKGWSWATIPDLSGKAGVFIDGDWVESKDQDPNGDVRLIQLADVGDGVYRDKSDRFMTKAKADELRCTFLKDDDVLIARMPEPLGRACIFPGDVKPSVTVVDVAIVRSGNGEFDHRWFASFVNAHPFRSAISGLQAGSTRKRISRGNLATIPLPVPPLPEQRRIVAEVEKQFTRLEAGVAALRRGQANLKRYRAAVLKAACEGRLVPTEAELQKSEVTGQKAKARYETGEELLARILNERRQNWKGRGKYKEPAAPDTASLPPVPDGWTWATVEQLTTLVATGATPYRGKPAYWEYFTPRPLIAAMVDVVRPEPGQAVCDPACGTGGFLLAAHDYLAKHHGLDRAQKKKLKSGTFFGIELVDSVTRLCAMNLLLHGIGGDLEEDLPVVTKDALAGKHGEYEIVLANPPFGKKSSVTIVNDAGETSKESLIINRDDFWASTSNKQLNFLQHIFTILKQHGRAAVVMPDNVLFEGGAGETIRRALLKQAEVHTLLRLPTGIFYAQGVKANVLFFDRKPAQEKPWTQKLWIYDLRTNLHFTLKENTLKRSDLDHFVACYFGMPGSTPLPNPLPGRGGEGASRHNRVETERFKSFTYEELAKRDKVNLDIFWLKDDALEESANLPAPEIIAADITADLEAALEQFATIAEDLKR